MTELFNEKQIRGITTELICMQKFIELGYIVSVPYGNNSRYDLLVDNGKTIWRIQCKTAKLYDNGSYHIQTCNKITNATKRKTKHYTKDEVDFIASIIEDQLVIIPVELIENSTGKRFRTELPKFGTTGNCNLIKDFTVEKYLI